MKDIIIGLTLGAIGTLVLTIAIVLDETPNHVHRTDTGATKKIGTITFSGEAVRS